MINRRNFINAGILVAGAPLLGNTNVGGKSSPTTVANADNANFYQPNRITPQVNQSYYISHRGVHLKQRIAGENTIQSMRLAKRAGFQCMEFDVRFTKDGKAVVIHDETINRTLRDLQGNKPQQPIYVKDLTFQQIRNEYVVFTENPKAKAIVPTFEEYVNACAQYKLIPFVEIKTPEMSKERYDYLLGVLDTIIGRGKYVMTSNNEANDKLRGFGYNNVMVMGILYQTTFAHIQSWKHTIMAISASRHTPEELQKNVRLANQQGILTESHADTIDKYSLIVKNGIDYISTDSLQPERTGYGQVISQLDINEGITELKTDGDTTGAQVVLKPGNYVELHIAQYKNLFLYGVALEMSLSGKCKCTLNAPNALNGKDVELSANGSEYFRYPVLLHKEDFKLKITATDNCKIEELKLTITKF